MGIERNELRNLLRRFMSRICDDPTFFPEVVKIAGNGGKVPAKVRPELDDVDYRILDSLCEMTMAAPSDVIAEREGLTKTLVGRRCARMAELGYVSHVEYQHNHVSSWRITAKGRRRAATPDSVA